MFFCFQRTFFTSKIIDARNWVQLARRNVPLKLMPPLVCIWKLLQGEDFSFYSLAAFQCQRAQLMCSLFKFLISIPTWYLTNCPYCLYYCLTLLPSIFDGIIPSWIVFSLQSLYQNRWHQPPWSLFDWEAKALFHENLMERFYHKIDARFSTYAHCQFSGFLFIPFLCQKRATHFFLWNCYGHF